MIPVYIVTIQGNYCKKIVAGITLGTLKQFRLKR